MAQATLEKSSKFDKIRALLDTGDCSDDFALNLPFRFFAYADKEYMDGFFSGLYKKLETAKKSNLPYTNGQDVWFFDEVIKIISPDFQTTSFEESVDFLKHGCGIEREELRTERQKIPGLLFNDCDRRQIYLSRSAMFKLAQKLMRKQISFQKDLDVPLFARPSTANALASKKSFEREMCALFAEKYFAWPDDNCAKLADKVQDQIRSQFLKPLYDSSNKALDDLFKDCHRHVFDPGKEKVTYFKELYHEFENFKLTNILNTLFQVNRLIPFLTQYRDAIKQFGFRLKKGRHEQWQLTNDKGDIMPMYPGPNYAMHIDLFLGLIIKAFCEFVEEESRPQENAQDWLNELTKKFFSAIRYGYDQAKNKDNFPEAPLFINQHNKVAKKAFNNIKNKADPKIKQSLFMTSYDEKDESNFLASLDRLEKTQIKQHEEFLATPCKEQAQKINDTEKEISNICETLYGTNFQAFIKVKEILSEHGQLIPRPIIGGKRPKEFLLFAPTPEIMPSENRSIQMNIFQSSRQQWEFKLWDLPYIPFQLDERFSRFNNYFASDPKGNRFCINELKYKTRNPETWLTTKNEESKTGRTILNCGFKYFLLESDDLDPMEQWEITQANKEYFWMAIWSAGEKGSIHNILPVLHEPKNIEEYHWVHRYLIKQLKLDGFDTTTIDNSRCSRYPNVTNPQTGGLQKLLQLNEDAIFAENWRPVFEAEKQEIERKRIEELQKTPKLKKSVSYNIDEDARLRNYWIVRIEKERDGLMKGEMAGNGRTRFYRRDKLAKMVNSLACKHLMPADFHNLLDCYNLEQRHIKYIDELYHDWTAKKR